MEEEDNIDMAAAMGFSSFGGTKKRKFDHASSPKAKADASGANSTKLGVRTKKVAGADEDGPEENQAAQTQRDAPTKSQATGSGLASFLARGQNLPEPPLGAQEAPGLPDLGQDSTTEMMSFGGPPVSRAELNALRNGVQNEHGDTAYFLPSFVEDPWVRLAKRSSGQCKFWVVMASLTCY